MGKKINVGFFSFTCCEGCVNIFVKLLEDYYDSWMENMDIKYCRLLKTNNEMKNLDLAFVEGAIATADELKMLKKIRKNSKFLVAIGSGAITGMPSSQRNNFSKELLDKIKPLLRGQRRKIQPIGDFVKVDDNVPGCPMSESRFLKVLNKYLGGKNG